MQKSTKSHYAKDVRGSRSPVSERLPSSPVSWRGLQGGSAPWKPSIRCKFCVMSQPSKRGFRIGMTHFSAIPGLQNTRLTGEKRKTDSTTREPRKRNTRTEKKGTRGSRSCTCGQPQMNLRLPAAATPAAKFRSKSPSQFQIQNQRKKEKRTRERKRERKKQPREEEEEEEKGREK